MLCLSDGYLHSQVLQFASNRATLRAQLCRCRTTALDLRREQLP